jgi:two-component system nitrate/nitrite response regulator NarL
MGISKRQIANLRDPSNRRPRVFFGANWFPRNGFSGRFEPRIHAYVGRSKDLAGELLYPNGRSLSSEIESRRFACRMVKMQEERKAPRCFLQGVVPPQSPALNLPVRDDAGIEPPSDFEARDSAAIRIVVADSETIYRVGIQKIFALEDDIRVIALADTPAGLHDAIQRFPTDVIVLVEDKLIARTVDTIPELIRLAPKLKIIVQDTQNGETNTVELYRQGVRGIIPRSISPDLLVKCVRKIAAGETWIDNQSINGVIEAYQSQATPQARPQSHSRLSLKELAIITCVTQGKRSKEIAYQLGASERVIRNHLRTVYHKVGVSGRLELALYCLHHSLHKKGARPGAPVAQPITINSRKF